MVAVASWSVWWSYHFSEARREWRQAQLELDAGYPDRAGDHLGRCLRWWGNRGDVRLAAARAARLSGHLDEAEEHLTLCERLPNRNIPTGSLRRERALLHVQQGDFGGHLATLVPRGPSDPDIAEEELEALAGGFAELGNDEAALSCLHQLFAKTPGHVRGHQLAGVILVRTDRAEEAVGEFQQAVTAWPDALAPRRRLAASLLELGRVREASRHLGVLRERFPDDAEVMFLQARAFVYQGRAEDAQGLLDQLLATAPDHVPGLVERGRLAYRAGDFQRACDWFSTATRREPNSPEAWNGLAYCRHALGQDAEAGRCRGESDRILREAGEATRMFAELSQQIGATDRPDAARYLELAERYERLHMGTRAAALRLQALLVNPQDKEARAALAAFYERTGQPHLAARQRALVQH